MKKRSVKIAGHASSVSLEEEFWDALKSLAARRGLSVSALITAIDETRTAPNLSSALRIAILQDLQSRAEE